MKRIAIFVDGSNLSAAVSKVGFRPDFDKIVSYFAREGEVVGSYYFTALPKEDNPLRKLTDRLEYNGWRLITKETKTYDNGPMKGNMDVEIVVQAFRMLEYITDLVLFSGDGDFRSMVEELQNRALRVTAVAHFAKNGDNMTADELRRQVNRFIPLASLRKEIALEIVETREEQRERRLNFLHGKEHP